MLEYESLGLYLCAEVNSCFCVFFTFWCAYYFFCVLAVLVDLSLCARARVCVCVCVCVSVCGVCVCVCAFDSV